MTIIDQLTTASQHARLTDIHINGVFIRALKKNDQCINLFYWNRFLVEIHCLFDHQQWIPVKVRYRLRTAAYTDWLMSCLTPEQGGRLQDIIRNQETN